jgi:DNA-binding SARP family transcriptional activator
LRVRLLGGLDIEGVDIARLGSRKGRLLIQRLAVARGTAVTTDSLVEAVWPDGDVPSRPADQVSVLVSRARAALGSHQLRRTSAGYVLEVGWLDVDAVTALVAEARQRFADGAMAAARAAADAALALARGPLLPEEAGALWAAADRAAVDRAVAEARVLVGEVALSGGDPWAAADAASQAVAVDSYDERALRVLLRALAATGRPAVALVEYTAAAERLRTELGIDPEPETEAIYLAILRGESVTPTPGAPAPAAPLLAGRSAEMRALDDALAHVRSRSSMLVAIEGEGGIGKTMLLDTWLGTLADEVLVLRGNGDELRAAMPLQPVLDALVQHVRALTTGDVAELLGADADLVAPLLGKGATGSSLPVSLAMLSGADSGSAVLFASLTGVLGRLASQRPVVLAIDDAHYADRSTAALLAQCMAQLRDGQLLVIVTRRPQQGPTNAATTTLHLGRLDQAGVAAVVGAERATELFERSGGHPLFLVELARSDGDDLPASIRSAVDERCAATGPAADTLRAAAVLGADVDLELLAAALRRSEADLLGDLEIGVHHHLLTDAGGGFAFPHAIIRDALHAGVLGGRQALLHREAARALAARPHRDPLRVAHHAREGGDLALAAVALVEAAELSSQRYDNDEALRLVDAAMELDPSPRVLVTRSRLLIGAERYEEGATAAAAALAAGGGAAAFEMAALAAYMLRAWERAERLATDGARLADDDEVRSSCWAIAGRVAHAFGRVPEAHDYFARARVDAPPNVMLLLDTWQALLLVHCGQPARAHDFVLGVGAATTARLPFLAPHRHMTAALALGDLGRPAEALAEAALLDAATREAQVHRFGGRGENIRAWVLRSLGAFEEADESNLAALDAAQHGGGAEAIANSYLDMAEGALRRGDLAGAQSHIDAATGPFKPHGMRWRHRLRSGVLASRLAFADGRYADAEELALDTGAQAAGFGIDKLGLAAQVMAARARNASGDAVDLNELSGLLERLDDVGALNAWLVTAEVAREFGVDDWARRAATRVPTLVANAGEWARTLQRTADIVLRDLPS